MATATKKSGANKSTAPIEATAMLVRQASREGGAERNVPESQKDEARHACARCPNGRAQGRIDGAGLAAVAFPVTSAEPLCSHHSRFA